MNTNEIVTMLRQVSDKLERSENAVSGNQLMKMHYEIMSEIEKTDFVMNINNYINEGDIEVTLDWENRVIVELPEYVNVEDFIIGQVGILLEAIFERFQEDLRDNQGIFSQE